MCFYRDSTSGRNNAGITAAKTITVELYGGMGNQMFQFAHALALAELFQLKLFVSFLDYGREYALHHFGINLSSQLPTPFELIVYEGSYDPESDWYTVQKIKECTSEHIRLRGYFQNENLFQPVSRLLLSIFKINRRNLGEFGERTPVCIHVRRGDFIGSAYHEVCSFNYYRSAISRIRKTILNPQFIVVSDDTAWCEKAFRGVSDIAIINEPDQFKSFDIMASCSAHILSNSTFGWWAAWLAQNEIVVVPDRFLSDRDWHIYPHNWIKIEC